jgi:hypothetical protein
MSRTAKKVAKPLGEFDLRRLDRRHTDVVVCVIGVISAMTQQSPEHCSCCDTTAWWIYEGYSGELSFLANWKDTNDIFVDYSFEGSHCERTRELLDKFLEHFELSEHPENQATVLEQTNFNTMH